MLSFYCVRLICKHTSRPNRIWCKTNHCRTRYSFHFPVHNMAALKPIGHDNLENLSELLDSVDTILTDCDGVLWNINTVIPGAPDVIQKLQQGGKKVYFVTNNSSKTRKQYAEKCSKMGISATEEEIIGSAYVTAQYVKHHLKDVKKAYCLGLPSLGEELTLAGISHEGIGPDPVPESWEYGFSNFKPNPEINCVIMGLDPYVSYMKLMKASRYLQEKNSHFVVTNMDSALPRGNGLTVPGTGSLVTALIVASGRDPIVCGKPNQPIFEVLQSLHNIDPSRTLMIGDRLDTDIMLGHKCGLKTLLVLSGFSSLEDARQKMASNSIEDQKMVPHYYTESMTLLSKLL